MKTYSKKILVTLPNLEFGFYDAAARFSGMKASVLIYEKLNFAPGCIDTKGLQKT